MNGYGIPNGSGNNRKPEDKTPENTVEESFSDGLFTIRISQDMAIRNQLRSGLVEALGKNQAQIPLFVSWPNWLDDGIVCLYAKDLHRIIHDAVRKTVNELGETFGIDALSGEGIFDIIPAQDDTIEAPVSVSEPPGSLPDTPPANPAKAASSKPFALSDLAAGSPYREGPTEAESPAEAPGPKRKQPVTDQDIADQLFAELRKGKKS